MFPARFIDEQIEVIYKEQPLLEKKPTCPDGFIWQGDEYVVEEILAEWQDYRRKGRMARNMIPEHAARASRTGSWGVGRFFFRVRVSGRRVFDLYYDRAPSSADDRKGRWILYREWMEG